MVKTIKNDFRTPENANNIFELLINGESLSKICSCNNWPKMTCYDWLIKEYPVQYAHAREMQAEFFVDKIRDISESVKPEKGEIQKARLEIDSIKWIASKMMPKKYGDKLEVDNKHDLSQDMKDFYNNYLNKK